VHLQKILLPYAYASPKFIRSRTSEDVCTRPERIPRWFLRVLGDLRVGGYYQLEGNAGGKIERCDPPNGFTATWECGGSVSWIEVRLSVEADGRTRFELNHVGLVDEHGQKCQRHAGWLGALDGVPGTLRCCR
jgi:uncharacterized protein YndB with AHSA1/START domain